MKLKFKYTRQQLSMIASFLYHLKEYPEVRKQIYAEQEKHGLHPRTTMNVELTEEHAAVIQDIERRIKSIDEKEKREKRLSKLKKRK